MDPAGCQAKFALDAVAVLTGAPALANITSFEKVAIVGGPEWAGKLTELIGSVIPGSYKAFETGDLEEAFEWVK